GGRWPLLPLRVPPVGVAGEARAVEHRHVPRERLVPGIDVAHVVDAAVQALLLPDEARVHVCDRAVTIVHIRQWRALERVAVLTRTRSRGHGPRRIPTRRLSRGRQPRTALARATAAPARVVPTARRARESAGREPLALARRPVQVRPIALLARVDGPVTTEPRALDGRRAEHG